MTGSPSYHAPKLSPLAENPDNSRGRLHPEAESRTRNAFARDRDRIIHAQAFRRLKGKTQVFVAHGGDHYRTRLTHSLEVAQIARSIAGALGLNADLAETIALAHDLGHPPFGHAGEDALSARMKGRGGFDHNVQSLSVVTELELRYPEFIGLNLTWETLEGIIKHNGPVAQRLGEPAWQPVKAFNDNFDLDLGAWASAEAQVAAVADDIAYNNHDVDDGLQAGLFGVDELESIPLIGPIVASVRRDWPSLSKRLLRLESVRRMIGVMVDDVLTETAQRAAASGVGSAADVRAMNAQLVGFSQEMTEDLARLRNFLHERMYRHFEVNRMRAKAERTLTEMFDLFEARPDTLPPEWSERVADAPARVICDYIAGMTDRYAIEEHRRLHMIEL